MTTLRFIVALLAWMWTSVATAFTFSYGGRLVDAQGRQVKGPVALSVSFYGTATGGSPALTITDGLTAVPLQEGIFQIAVPLAGSDLQAAFPTASASVWIEITDLTNRPQKPYERQLVSMMPFAAKIPVDAAVLEYNADGALTLKNAAAPAPAPAPAPSPGPAPASGPVPDSSLSSNVSLLGQTIELGGAEVAGTLPIARGGTGTTTASGAANALLPTQAAQTGKFLTTDGTNVSWSNATVSTLSSSGATPATALTVDADGEIGIGTTNPQRALDVRGPAAVNGVIGLYGSSSRGLEFGNGLGNAINGAVGVSGVDNVYFTTSAQGDLNIAAGGSYKLNFGIGTANRMVIANDGRVGIGVTAPEATLHVKAGTGQGILNLQSAQESDQVHLQLTTGFAGWNVNKTAIVASGGSYSRSDLHFVLNSAADNNVDYTVGTDTRMMIKNDGNVAIGNTFASVPLHVGTGGAATQWNAYTLGYGTGTPQIQYSNGGMGEAAIGVFSVDGSDNKAAKLFVSYGGNPWGLYHTSGGTAAPFVIADGNSERLRIDGTGKVGIATPDPKEPLHVAGAVRVDGVLKSRFATGESQANFNGSGETAPYLKLFDSMTGGAAGISAAAQIGYYEGDHIDSPVITMWGGSPDGRNMFDVRKITNVNSPHATGTSLFTVRESGRVGIGTTDPTFPLTVMGPNTGASLAFFGQSGAGSGLEIASQGNDQAPSLVFRRGDGAPRLTISSVSGCCNRSQFESTGPITINEGGQPVGVGTNSPQATLDIAGTMALNPQSSAPFGCVAAKDGVIALTSSYMLCVCKSSVPAWVAASDGAGTCNW